MEKVKIEEMEKMVKEINEKGFDVLTKMYIVYIASDFEQYDNLTTNEKENLVQFVHDYWINSDLTENGFYNILDIIFNYDSCLNNLQNKDYRALSKTIEAYL